MQSRIVSVDQILPGLWIGNWAAAKYMDTNVVINMTPDIPFYNYHAKQFRCSIWDPHFEEAVNINQRRMALFGYFMVILIDYFLKTGKTVLVHCHSGIQRSASLVLMYLIYKKIQHPMDFLLKHRGMCFYWGRRVHFRSAIRLFTNMLIIDPNYQ